MLKSNDERIVINEHIENDPLSENNLDKTLDLINEIRLSCPQKSIWLYTGYTWEQLFNGGVYTSKEYAGLKRRNIIKQCDVLIDGKYINSQRDITLPYRGSKNQRLINTQQSLQKGKIVLWQA